MPGHSQSFSSTARYLHTINKRRGKKLKQRIFFSDQEFINKHGKAVDPGDNSWEPGAREGVRQRRQARDQGRRHKL